MSVAKTHIASIEITCDHCGQKNVENYIEGLSDGMASLLPTGWVSFNVVFSFASMPPATIEACSFSCFQKICADRYKAWMAAPSPPR